MTKSVIVHRMVKQHQKNKNKKNNKDTTKRSFINKHQIDTEKLKKIIIIRKNRYKNRFEEDKDKLKEYRKMYRNTRKTKL